MIDDNLIQRQACSNGQGFWQELPEAKFGI
jgi:hypothetical protein